MIRNLSSLFGPLPSHIMFAILLFKPGGTGVHSFTFLSFTASKLVLLMYSI